MKLVILFTAILVVGLSTLATAEVPQMINYQGYLTKPNGQPVPEDSLDITFAIYGSPAGGVVLWTSGVQRVNLEVGRFTYLLGSAMPFSDTLFSADTLRWLGLMVGADPEITPRTRLVSVPYSFEAVRADTSNFSISVADNAITTIQVEDGTLLFDDIGQNSATTGQVMKWNGSAWTAGNDSIGSGSKWTVTDSVLYTNGYWGIARGGANNVLYGDSVHTMVNLGVACTTGTSAGDRRWQTVSGGYGNVAASWGSTIGGGKRNTTTNDFGTIAGGGENTASGDISTISGGYRNSASDIGSTVGGGQSNTAGGIYSTVGGGDNNTSSGFAGTVAGGQDNTAGEISTVGGGQFNTASYASTVSGGESCTASGSWSTIGGGWQNNALGNKSTVAGGYENVVAGDYSSILGGYADTITSSADYSYLFGIGSNLSEDSTFMVDMPHIRFGDETEGYEFPNTDGAAGQVIATDGGGQLNWTDPASQTGSGWADDGTIVRLETSDDSVGIGTTSPVEKLHVEGNLFVSGKAAIGSGHAGTGAYSFVSGYGNAALGDTSVVGGGTRNTASNTNCTVSGGVGNNATGYSNTIGGGGNNQTADYASTVGGGSSNNAVGYGASVGGGQVNRANGTLSTISGGEFNTADGTESTVGGGGSNNASAGGATISGGTYNYANGYSSTIGGGQADTASGYHSTIGGGLVNVCEGDYGTIGGGEGNTITGNWGTTGGGLSNTSGGYATVGGGNSNSALGNGSTIAGGRFNYAFAIGSVIGGGESTYVAADYSCILGGFGDTITSAANYSYLFGIRSTLTQDSTFMVDMPHIRFGDEATGYEFPTEDGTAGQVMSTDGNGQMSWSDVAGGGGGWTDDGNIVRLGTGTDSVGIGTASPGEKLDVSGNIHASGTISSGNSIAIDGTVNTITSASGSIGFDDENLLTTGQMQMGSFSMTNGAQAGRVLTSDAGGTGTWQPAPSGGVGGSGSVNYIPKFTGSTTLGNSVIYQGGNNLGIGITNFADRLTVEGSIRNVNSSGQLYCRMSHSSGVGYFSTYGPGGSINMASTWVAGYTGNGAVTVNNSSSQSRAAIMVNHNGGGLIQTRDANGYYNTRLTYLNGYPNHGYVAVSDDGGVDRAGLMTNESGGGSLVTAGPNDNTNVHITHLNSYPNNGYVGVFDASGNVRALMYVNSSGQGIISGDVKSFHVENTDQPGTDIWYSSLEGPEAAAYVRGTATLVNGSAVIRTPDHFKAVASSQDITVQVTPLSADSKGLAVVGKSVNSIIVMELLSGTGSYEFDYTITAVRQGYENYEVIRSSTEAKGAAIGLAAKDNEKASVAPQE